MAEKNKPPEGSEPSKRGKGKTGPDSRWKKGPSHNPKGRPKRNTAKVDWGERAIHDLARRAAMGEAYAIRAVLQLIERYGSRGLEPPAPDDGDST